MVDAFEYSDFAKVSKFIDIDQFSFVDFNCDFLASLFVDRQKHVRERPLPDFADDFIFLHCF